MKNYICPSCGSLVDEVKHRIGVEMIRGLCNLAKVGGGAEINGFGLTAKQRSKFYELKYWGLIENRGGGSGWWKLTSKGLKFVTGAITVQRYVYTYRGESIRNEGNDVGVDIWDGDK